MPGERTLDHTHGDGGASDSGSRTLQSRPARPEAPRRAPGSKFGRYVVVGELGSGGAGVVYSGFDPELDRTVAIKVLRTDPAAGEDASRARARLHRESQALAKLSHPNVVQCFDVGVHDDDVFLIMELVEGATLSEWLRAESRAIREVLHVFLAAGRGLVGAHAAGLIHRDFKPSNVLVGDDRRVRVTDFGLAKEASGVSTHEAGRSVADGTLSQPGDSGDAWAADDLTRTGLVVGTPAYMAPEQHFGYPADARTDQFAYCAALFEALHGVRAFPQDSYEEVAAAKHGNRIATVPEGSRVSRAIDQAIRRGLAPEPDDRWESMAAVLDVIANDPSYRKRGWLGRGAIAGTLGLGVAGLVLVQSTDADVCSGAEADLEGIWDDARRHQVRAALLETDASYAEATADRVGALLDRHARSWVDTHVLACEETAAGHQTTHVLDMRMACLHHRLGELRAVTDVLADADAVVVERAVQAAERLSPPGQCGSVEYLEADVAPPDDPQAREAVATQRSALARANALHDAGRYEAAFEVAEGAAAAASELAYSPLVAEAGVALGQLQLELAHYEDAERTLTRAYFVAVGCGHDRVALSASHVLARTVGDRLARTDEGLEWARHGQAIVERTSFRPDKEAALLRIISALMMRNSRYDEALDYATRTITKLEECEQPGQLFIAAAENNLGNVLSQQARYEDAIEHHRRSLSIFENMLGPDHPEVAGSMENLGVALGRTGKRSASIELFRRALVINERAFGRSHPRVASSTDNIANGLKSIGRYDESLALHRRSISIWQRELGTYNPSVAHGVNNLGGLLENMGRLEEAVVHHRRALDIYRRVHGPVHRNVAMSHHNLGITLLRLERPEEALEHARSALAGFEQVHGPEHHLVGIAHNGIGRLLLRLHRHALAEQEFVLAERILRHNLGDEHPHVAAVLGNLGEVNAELKNWGRAREYYESSLAIRERAETEQTHVAEMRFSLAQVLWSGRQDRARAVALAKRALAFYRTIGELGEPDVVEVERWLAGRRR